MAETGSKKSPLNSIAVFVLAILIYLSPAARGQESVPDDQNAQSRHSSGKNSGKSGSAKPGGTKMAVSGKYLHLSCTRQIRDLKNNTLECFGNVYIRRPNELLTADYALMDLKSDQMHAEGNVVYFTQETVVYGVKMDFNFATETGVIFDGRIESDKFQLLGEKIERQGIGHFVAIDGEYTTCRDCPASWKMAGSTIDMQVDGYAKMSQVFIKVNDAPALYLPYVIIPIKTKRQSGLMFPRFQLAGENGFTYVQPYFWAISRSTDATLAAGLYSRRGFKAEGQYRYVLTPRSHGQIDAFYLRDKKFIRDPYYNRWAINSGHNIELPWRMEFKMNYLDASDRDYARKIGDIPGTGEPALVSEAGLSRTGRDVSVWVSAKRIHNLLTPGLTGFDANTVQLLPSVSVATTDHRVFEALPLNWSLSMNYSRFYRDGPTFDPIYPVNFVPPSNNFFLPGSSPLRRGQRFNIVPELYFPARIAEVIELLPSVQYRTYGYMFDQNAAAPTSRGYLLAQTEVATTIESVYGNSVKHKFRPALTYSNIPLVQQNVAHPFIQQLSKAGNEFDESDIVPISNASQLYFVPLGNSLSYQFGNKFILKQAPGSYKKVVDVQSGQSIDFTEYKAGSHLQSLSRFFTLVDVETPRVNAHVEYYYYPSIRTPTYSVNMNYVFVRYTRRLLGFERSLGFNYSYNQVTASNVNAISTSLNWSINDFFGFTAGITYSFPSFHNNTESPGVIQGISGGLTYQSPSQCYKLVLLASRTVDNPTVAVTFNVPVNLTGDGFTNFQDSGSLAPTGH